MKYIGLDLGSVTCGIAASEGYYAKALTTIRFKKDYYEEALEKLAPIIKENKVENIVLGLPLNMNGTVGERAEICMWFKEQLEDMYPNIPVVLQDERLTTVEAEDYLISFDVSRKKRKKIIDQQAATVILQAYLDHKK